HGQRLGAVAILGVSEYQRDQLAQLRAGVGPRIRANFSHRCRVFLFGIYGIYGVFGIYGGIWRQRPDHGRTFAEAFAVRLGSDSDTRALHCAPGQTVALALALNLASR